MWCGLIGLAHGERREPLLSTNIIVFLLSANILLFSGFPFHLHKYYCTILCNKIVRFLQHKNVGTLCPWSGEVPANSAPEPRRCVECLPDVRCHPTPVTLCLYPVSTIYLYTVQSVGSIYSLYTGQSAGCRPIKGLMRQGSGLQDPAPALESICQRTHLQPSFGCRELGIIIYIAGYKLSAEGTGQWSVSRLETCAATPRN